MAAYIITCVGSLETIHIRTAGALEGKKWERKMEIVSLEGTLFHGGCHIHISLSDENGYTIGGHLLEGCKIFTTAEIVIGDAAEIEFTREQDPATGCLELRINSRKEPLTS